MPLDSVRAMADPEIHPIDYSLPHSVRWRTLIRREGFDILWSLCMRIGKDNVSILAAGVAFYVFVAIPAALTAVVAVYGLVFNTADVESQVLQLTGVMPGDVIDIVESFLKMLATRPKSTLDVRLLVGLGVAIWSAQSAASSMITALNAVYEKQDDRGFFRFQFAALILSVYSIVFALLSLLLFASAPEVLEWLPIAGASKAAIIVLRWPALCLLVALAIAGVYRFAPARDGHGQRWGISGVLLTTVIWIGSSALFALYVGNVASYDASYGSLGGVVVLLLWLYLAVFVVLLGAELNAEIDRRLFPEDHLPQKRPDTSLTHQ